MNKRWSLVIEASSARGSSVADQDFCREPGWNWVDTLEQADPDIYGTQTVKKKPKISTAGARANVEYYSALAAGALKNHREYLALLAQWQQALDSSKQVDRSRDKK